MDNIIDTICEGKCGTSECGHREGRTNCCQHCAESLGYFVFNEFGFNTGGEWCWFDTPLETTNLPKSEEAMKLFEEMKSKYKFDEKDGFLTETGCSIPREERSGICQASFCEKIKDIIGTESKLTAYPCSKDFKDWAIQLIKDRNKEGRLG